MKPPTDIDAAEKRGHSRGYAAGRKRVKADREYESERRHMKARRERIFTAVLTGLLPQSGWTMGKKSLSSMDDYVELAARFADASIKALDRRPLP